ncbi:MAG: carboxypeptidase M32 [Defluviitaleaceae bacterium]|nr:carboxypeptidase M32 [Defluviitaleaceae bacterium]
MNVEETVKAFKAYLGKIKMYREAMSTLSFDGETVAPIGSTKSRAKRAGFFSLEVFNLTTSDEMKAYLDALAPHVDTFDDVLKGEYRLAKKSYEDKTKIPADIVREMGELQEEAAAIWGQARAENDFDKFAPYLKRLIELKKKVIEYRGETSKKPYDLLLDDYEDGMNMEVYDAFFNQLKEAIVPLLKKIKDSNKKIDTRFVHEKVGLEAQKAISKQIATQIGYDLDRGYIAESTHPFCNGSNKYDVRITTRYDEADFFSSFYSVMHECGHAIYEQNISDDIAHQIVGSGASMGIHESQSRFYENILGRSLTFWEVMYAELQTLLPETFDDVTAHQFYEAVNEVKASFIRVEADELTYNLHIIIRYEIERLLFNEDIDVYDLPAIWNQKYEDYLGITPSTNAEGVLQDIHWSFGAFGYFPTYALGSAYAAQIAAHMKKDLDVEALIKAQDFAAIKNWLGEKIHQYGKTYTPNELMKKSFGETFNADYYVNYLTDKYSNLYELTS